MSLAEKLSTFLLHEISLLYSTMSTGGSLILFKREKNLVQWIQWTTRKLNNFIEKFQTAPRTGQKLKWKLKQTFNTLLHQRLELNLSRRQMLDPNGTGPNGIGTRIGNGRKFDLVTNAYLASLYHGIDRENKSKD